MVGASVGTSDVGASVGWFRGTVVGASKVRSASLLGCSVGVRASASAFSSVGSSVVSWAASTGAIDGKLVKDVSGTLVGGRDGDLVGTTEGTGVISSDGTQDGPKEGNAVGCNEGNSEGSLEGRADGKWEGLTDGFIVELDSTMGGQLAPPWEFAVTIVLERLRPLVDSQPA